MDYWAASVGNDRMEGSILCDPRQGDPNHDAGFSSRCCRVDFSMGVKEEGDGWRDRDSGPAVW